VRACRP